MASLGVVMMDQKLGFESIWDQVLEYLGVRLEREVHFWPVGGTYWRGSWGVVSWYRCVRYVLGYV
jgi:hypothetical protein